MATGGREDFRCISNATKIGTAVPNRIFVGGISGNTNEEDLRHLFARFGNVRATKIIIDKHGISKGYGFVTFETEEEAHKVLVEVDGLFLKDRKLNIAPAFKKQPYNRMLDSDSLRSSPIVLPATVLAASSALAGQDSIYVPQPMWPYLWPHQFYLHQQCHYPANPQIGYPQYAYSIASPEYYASMAQMVSLSDYSETSSADSNESGRDPKIPVAAQTKGCRVPTTTVYKYANGNAESCNFTSPQYHMHHPVVTKTVNGMAVMAYPGSFLMGSPTLLHFREGGNETDSVLAELGYFHSPIAAGAMTPPPTPLTSMSRDFNASMEPHHKN